MSIKLLSMDTSSSATGIAKYVDSKFQEYTLLETSKKIKGDEKLDQMIDLIIGYLKHEEPDIIVCEKVVSVRNAQTTRILQELTGAIRGYCIEHHIGYHSLSPTEWRKTAQQISNTKPISRKREDLKQWSLDIVNNVLGIETESNDISDAILIGQHYISLFS